jgi:cathepsin B
VQKSIPITFTAIGEVYRPVSGGTVTITVSMKGVTIHKETDDLCTLTTCPVPKGPLKVVNQFTFPSLSPSGTYDLKIVGTGSDNAALFCIFVNAQIQLIPPAIDPTIVAFINSLNTTWQAGFSSRFEGLSRNDVADLCGVLPGGPRLPIKNIPINAILPDSFDARVKWPKCPSIAHIRDQANCGSCWAFGAAAAMTDRLCIANGGVTNPPLASQDLLACCRGCGSGCQGGYPDSAWDYYQQTGLVSGGDYGGEGCLPYFLPSCDHHIDGSSNPCGATVSTPSCIKSCKNGANWSSDKHFSVSSYSVGSSEQQIMQEIFDHGPVEGAFSVYEDFPTYKSGVYQHHTGSYLGGHAIKIMGWGIENGVKYWLIANSWNTHWGDQGTFKILRGSDHCGIEDQVVAGMPKV